MKKIFTILTFAFIINVNAQTNVSGGIYSNTTWSLSGSPYIVTDTVVVFPGITLTIQPGVTVKFANNQLLEIRQAKLVAVGTITDSITFTSSSATPTKGIYQGIYINTGNIQPVFNYCDFKYANYAINTNYGLSYTYTLNVKNSSFISNANGIETPYTPVLIDSCYFRGNTGCFYGYGAISNCRIINNTTGLATTGNPTPITNCVIESNQVGINGSSYTNVSNCSINYNQTGMTTSSLGSTITNCTINKNYIGITLTGGDALTNCIVDSNRHIGIELSGGGPPYPNSVSNCHVIKNAIGIDASASDAGATIKQNIIQNDSIGIFLATYQDTFYCNTICNNSPYDLKYTGTNNTHCVVHNYWCTSDSTATEAVIYDGYDNINYGLVSFMPFDSSCSPPSTCIASVTDSLFFVSPLNWDVVPHYSANITSAVWHWGDGSSTAGLYPSHTYSVAGRYNICVTAYASCGDSATFCQNDTIYRTTNSSSMINVNVVSSATGISQISSINSNILVYPNPNNGNFTIETSATEKQTIALYDVNGKLVLNQTINSKTNIDASILNEGVYNLSIISNEGVTNKRLVIVR